MTSNLLGVIIGGVIGVAGSIVPHLWEQRRARRSTRAMLRAYISGILRMDDVRQHVSLCEQNIAALKAGATKEIMKIFGAENQQDEFQSVIISRLGFLEPNVARDAVLFCNMYNGIGIDVKAMTLGKMDNLTVSKKIILLEHILQLWKDTHVLGRELVSRLD